MFDVISFVLIYFFVVIGFVVMFGVMGVINMVYGEFIMMGVYIGYVI